MMKIPYGKQEVTEEDIQSVIQVLKSPFLTQGPKIEEFENKVAEMLGAPYAVAVNSATSALHLAVHSLGLKPGERVLVTANSFVATANCVRYCQGQVDFVDIDPVNYGINIEAVASAITNRPRGYYKGVITVDFAGHPVAIDRLAPIIKDYGMWLISDSCHAIGARFKDQSQVWWPVGGSPYADVTIFSFHPVKHIATGEGGMLVTRRKDLNDQFKKLRSHGIEKSPDLLSRQDGGWYYEMQELGWNYRITDMQAALGCSQISRLEKNLIRRKEIAAVYNEKLSGLPITLPQVIDGADHAYHLYVIRTEKRLELYNYLHKNGVFCQVHYIPIPDQPYYKRLYGEAQITEARRYYSQALSLPMYHSLSREEQSYVIQLVKNFFNS